FVHFHRSCLFFLVRLPWIWHIYDVWCDEFANLPPNLLGKIVPYRQSSADQLGCPSAPRHL
ncbi:MAG: hypothetical protein FWH40_09765, partial [Coriobacteriia bacterium]|nr:hypothetical protein [Coriobacteriia bacterium]